MKITIVTNQEQSEESLGVSGQKECTLLLCVMCSGIFLPSLVDIYQCKWEIHTNMSVLCVHFSRVVLPFKNLSYCYISIFKRWKVGLIIWFSFMHNNLQIINSLALAHPVKIICAKAFKTCRQNIYCILSSLFWIKQM